MIEDPHEAIRELAHGRLRGRSFEAWELVDAAWTVLQGFVRRQFIFSGLPNYLWEDCGQAVLERVWKYRSTYRGDSERAFWAWLRTICRNERNRCMVKERNHPMSLTAASASCAAEGDGSGERQPFDRSGAGERNLPLEEAMDRETRSALQACLSRLNEKQGTIIHLLYLRSELTEREVAAVMGCSPSYVHKIKEQAIELLRKCLENKGVQ